MAHKKLLAIFAVAATAAAMGMTGTATADSTTGTTVLVTQDDIVTGSATPTAGDTSWYVELKGSGAYSLVDDYGAPDGLDRSSLQLTTGTGEAKVKLMTNQFAGTTLNDITTLAYQTYQAPTGQWEGADAAFQLRIDLDGDVADVSDETTLVYEPYQAAGTSPIEPAAWQSWDVLAGSFWSTRASDHLVAGNGGSTMYTLQQVLGFHPDAAVLGVGVNVGGNNANYTVATDGVTFGTAAGTTVFNFEHLVLPTDKDECKADGWQTSFLPGQFKNQGDCVSSVASSGASHSAR